MKYLIGIVIFFFSVNIFAKQQDIVVIVNDKPITMYEFTVRKKMVIALNNVDNSDINTDKQLNKNVLNLLIEEELLNQHAEKTAWFFLLYQVAHQYQLLMIQIFGNLHSS